MMIGQTMNGGGDGVLLCGHGSRDPLSVAGFAEIARGLVPYLAGRPFAHGFMELAEPALEAAVGTLVAAGARRVLAVPGFLMAARHVQEDLPRLLAEAARRHGVDCHLGRALWPDARLTAALADRAEAVAPDAASRADMALLLVGAGSSSAEANAELVELAAALGRSLGFKHAAAAFASVAAPAVGAAVDDLVVRGFRRILLLPWFLTEGRLLGQARAEAEAAAGQAELTTAAVLGTHPLVLETLAARMDELAQGLAR